MTLAETHPSEMLTPREAEVVALMMHGVSTTAGLACALHVSSHTVHYFMSQIFQKLDCDDRVQVVSHAWRNGIVVDNRWVRAA